jgi:hypothetical protein
MKTVLLIILSVALLSAAVFTRPGKREFVLYLLDARSSGHGWRGSDLDDVDDLARKTAFKDWLLFTSIEKDGKAMYTGAFAHWFAHGPQKEKALPSAKELVKLIGG